MTPERRVEIERLFNAALERAERVGLRPPTSWLLIRWSIATTSGRRPMRRTCRRLEQTGDEEARKAFLDSRCGNDPEFRVVLDG
jgi:hypothetical protein